MGLLEMHQHSLVFEPVENYVEQKEIAGVEGSQVETLYTSINHINLSVDCALESSEQLEN